MYTKPLTCVAGAASTNFRQIVPAAPSRPGQPGAHGAGHAAAWRRPIARCRTRAGSGYDSRPRVRRWVGMPPTMPRAASRSTSGTGPAVLSRTCRVRLDRRSVRGLVTTCKARRTPRWTHRPGVLGPRTASIRAAWAPAAPPTRRLASGASQSWYSPGHSSALSGRGTRPGDVVLARLAFGPRLVRCASSPTWPFTVWRVVASVPAGPAGCSLLAQHRDHFLAKFALSAARHPGHAGLRPRDAVYRTPRLLWRRWIGAIE